MENLNDPGITILLIRLLRANIQLAVQDGKQEYNLVLTEYSRTEVENGKYLDVQAAFDLMHGLEKPLFKFTCLFAVRYQKDSDQSLPWEKFTPGTTLAHIIPYLREFASNMTNRLPVPVLILPPVNAHALFAAYEQRRQAGTTAIPSPAKPS